MPRLRTRCPHCLTRTLTEVPFQDQHVFQCTTCQGLWFEDGELNDLISRFDPDIQEHCHASHLGKRLGTGQRQCRHCDIAMEHHHLLADYTVEIDRCSGCDGVWIDHAEVDQVLHSPRIIEAMKNLNKGICWRSWLFQFLTQMPVEYNVASHRTPWVTYSMIVLCSLVFVLGLANPGAEQWLLNTYAVQTDTMGTPSMLLQLLSYQFLHGGWLHLIGNMYFLWIIGDNIEDVLGHWRFLALYLLAGAVAALAELAWFHLLGGQRLLLVGASGSIAALFGLYLIWFRYSSLTFMILVFQKKLAPHWYFLIWCGLNLFGMLSGQGGVAFMAHLAGFAFGLLVGRKLKTRIERDNPLVRLLNAPEARLRR